MKKEVKKILSVLLIVILATTQVCISSSFANNDANKITNNRTSEVLQLDQLIEDNYSSVLEAWGEISDGEKMQLEILPSSFEENKAYVVTKSASHGYASETVKWEKNTEINLDVMVEKTGLYHLAFDYFVLDDSILPSEGYVKINSSYPFYEARRIVFNNLWESNDRGERLDRYGNELLPRSNKVAVWQKTYAYDASYLHTEPLKFKLDEGINRITLVNTRGDLLLGKIYIESPSTEINYEQYLKSLPDDNFENSDNIVVEAEDIYRKNDSAIRLQSEREPSLTPYDTKRRLLNIIDGTSWLRGGQEVTWKFDVEKDGFYSIGFKYKQDKKYDLPVYRSVKIDGKLPFNEVDHYPFHYSNKWGNEILSNGEQPYRFYLKKGTHTLTLTVNLSKMRPLAERITATMKGISDLTLQIQKLTGNKVDKYRDWTIVEYIPDLQDRLLRWANDLEKEYTFINSLNPSVSEVGEVLNLKIAIKNLRRLAEDPNELPNRLNQLSQGSSSVSQLLGDLLQRITESPLYLDKIYIFNNQTLPKPNAGALTKLSENIKRFFLSFNTQEYSTSITSNGELNVWVNRPRQYVELIQKMIDESFTPQSGIRVKLSIMPDENKLVLANASGQQPDVTLGVNHWLPYELSLRGAVLDLTQFEDFDEVIQQFSKGAIIPFTFEEGVYALPETQNFWVLFYRKDILQSLQLPVPDTWEEVVEILPELQRLGMNFYEPLALYRGFKPFVATTPFIYQFGGELFTDDGMRTAIDSEEALEGIKFMTDLFTIYNVPQDIPNFYHHFRYGTLPIGISDFTTYIQLRTAAPEIANRWDIALHPGVEREGEIQRWAPAGGQTGMIFKDTTYPEEAWEFLKWWLSTEVQIDFANTMQTTFGETYMWNTANLRAFEQLPWPEEHKEIILEQFEWVREASRVPGSYMVEREISNVWNKIVFDGDNPRTTIDDSVVTINREIARKMEEFGYVKDGKPIKPYPVPTIDTIDDWIEDHE